MASQITIDALRECSNRLEDALAALGEAEDDIEGGSDELIALWWDIKDASDAVYKQLQKVDPDDA